MTLFGSLFVAGSASVFTAVPPPLAAGSLPPATGPSLDFSDPGNSQYEPVIFGDDA